LFLMSRVDEKESRYRSSSRVRLGKASQELNSGSSRGSRSRALVNPDLFPLDCTILFAILSRRPSTSRRLLTTSCFIHIGAHTEPASWRPFRTKWPSTSPGQTRSNSRTRRNHSHAAQLAHSVRNPYKAAMRHL
jgi:hypothetical protein